MFNGRLYFNIGAMYHYLVEKAGMPSAQLLANLGGPDQAGGLPLPDQPFRPWRTLRYLPRMLKLAARRRKAPEELKKALPALDEATREAASLDPASLSERELLDHMAPLPDVLEPFLQILNDCNNGAFAAFGALRFICRGWCGDAALANDLVVGLDMTKTAEGSAELWRIAARATADPETKRIVASAVPRDVLERLEQSPATATTARALRGYLQRYGHRCANELEIMSERWVDDPAPLLAIFKAYVASPPEETPEAVQERQRRTREAALAKVESCLSRGWIRKLFPWRKLYFRSVLRDAQRLVPMREDPKFYLLRFFLPRRRLMVELGRRLTAGGVLDAPDDIFFVEQDELLALTEPESAATVSPQLKERVRKRRDDHRRWSELEPVPALDADGNPIALLTQAQEEGRVLRGLAASTGRVTGVARVITDLSQADQMRHGEILVAPFTDPGWTPLFPLAAAIVMDLGGLLSHGAIVAREYGVPAVVNTSDATKLIRTGDRITVDGSEGAVYLSSDRAADSGV
jgi:pyruvate,water dikinase